MRLVTTTAKNDSSAQNSNRTFQCFVNQVITLLIVCERCVSLWDVSAQIITQSAQKNRTQRRSHESNALLC